MQFTPAFQFACYLANQPHDLFSLLHHTVCHIFQRALESFLVLQMIQYLIDFSNMFPFDVATTNELFSRRGDIVLNITSILEKRIDNISQ